MSITCRLIDGPVKGVKLSPGDMWFSEKMREKQWEYGYALSNEYKRDWADKRAPIWVVLPSGTWFCVDSKTSESDNGWTVTGEAPNITVSPSINCVGIYHGWLQNGILSDDCEGRTFG